MNNHGLDPASPVAGPPTPTRLGRGAVEALQAAALGLAFFALALSALTVAHRSGRATPIWPANGVVLFCLLRTPARRWPSLLLAGLVGNLAATLAAGDSVYLSAGFALSNSLEIGVGAAALRRIVGADIDLTRHRDLMAFGALACIVAPLCSAWFVFNWVHSPTHPVSLTGLGTWVLSDSLGAAIVAPALLAIQPSAFRTLWAPGTLGRNIVRLSVLVGVLVLVFGQSRIPLAILVLPALLWVTFRMEFVGAALGVLLTAAIATASSMAGRGPAVLIYGSPLKQAIALQIVLAIAAFSILPVAAALTRSRQLKASLAASLRAAEAARAESQEAQRWARMAQQIADVGYFRLANAPGGSRWSEEVYRIHGADPARGPLNATIEAIHPDDRALVEEGLRAARQDAKPFSGQYRIRRADGAFRTVSCRTISELDAAGQVTAVVGALVDITPYKMIEAAALESEARYRLLAEKSSDIISRIDIEGLQTYISPASVSILGYAPEELVGRMAMDFVHPDDQEQLYQAYDSQAEMGREHASQPVRYRYRHKNGDWVWLETHPTVIFDENREALEFVSVTRDVTLAKAAETELTAAREAAEAVAQAKSEFLANMSHEIRTPLTSIMGFSGLLRAVDNLPDNARPYVDRISTAGESLLAVVNDILDFSKLEAGQLELDPQAFDPRVFLHETAQLLAIQAANKGLALSVAFDGPAPERVVADSARLRQVLLNLIGNGIKFTDQGSVSVRAAYDEDGGGRLRVSVSDTGRGIPPERRDRLFQRFSQVDGSVSRTHGGTGLGLAICKNLVELMDGAIGVRSEDGQGSTFWLTIAAPAAKAETATDLANPDIAPDDEMGRGARVLIVDDLAVNRELVRAMLTPFGHDFEEASNGAEAVQAALRSGFDLILMDLQMPGMDGFEAARTIRATAPLNRATPIIALSANVLPAHVVACREAGMDDHLGKPISLPALASKVAMWAGEQHQSAPAEARLKA